MEFKKNYFNSGAQFNKNQVLYRVKDAIPFGSFTGALSKKHFTLFLINKWKYFRDCKTILDAGCGRGEFMELNPYKIKVAGVDIIKEEVNKLKEKGLNVQYADLKKRLSFKDNSFDGILNSHVLEHLDPEDGVKMISEFKRVLMPGGILVIAVPNFSFKRFYADYTHKRPYPKEALFRILKDNGFCDIQIFNGACLNQVISGLFFIFPKLRLSVEKFFGLFWPSEFIAAARKQG